MATNGFSNLRDFLCIRLAKSSFPVPVAPNIRTGVSVGANRSAVSISFSSFAFYPTMGSSASGEVLTPASTTASFF